jgi:hypothetical protein
VSRLYEPTPWARRNLTDAHREEIAEGPEVAVDLGYSGGWTCRLLDEKKRLLAEVFRHASAIGAYRAAVALLPEYATFRGMEVEVA